MMNKANKKAFLTVLSILLLLCASCTIERLFPGKVADGAARLTVNNFANLIIALSEIKPVDDRPECDLTNPFSGTPTVTSEKDGIGSVSWSFENCAFDFGSKGTTVESESSCGGQTTKFFGKVEVSGKRTITGILTGNDGVPVIPSGPEGLEYDFTKVTFENYRVESQGQENIMTNNSGSIAFKIRIHLGKDKKDKFCMVPLPNPTLSNIRYSPGEGAAESIVTLPGLFGDFQTTIDWSQFRAQVGVYAPPDDQQKVVHNELRGAISVWGSKINLTSDDTYRLDPALDQERAQNAFDSKLSCIDELEFPAQAHCTFEQDAATGISQLTILNLGYLLQAISDPSGNNNFPSTPQKPQCNLGSTQNPTRIDKRDNNNSRVIWEFEDCTYDFGVDGTTIVLGEGDDKKATKFFGKVTLNGRRSLSGLVIDSPVIPVAPLQGAMPIEFDSVLFEGFRVEGASSIGSLTMESGKLSMMITVHLEIDTNWNIFRTPKSNLTFEDVKFLEPSMVILKVQKGRYKGDFALKVNTSAFRAQNEAFRDDENIIEGSISMFGAEISIPKKTKLNPQYQSQGTQNNADSQSEASLEKLEGYLANSAARLSIQNLGNLLGALVKREFPPQNKDQQECYLRKMGVIENLTSGHEGSPGQEAEVIWSFENCEFDFKEGTSIQIEDDPQAAPVTFSGKVRVSGKKSIYGYLTDNNRQPVVPKLPALNFNFEEIEFENFKVSPFNPEAILNIKSGKTSFRTTVHLSANPETKLLTDPLENITFDDIQFGEKTAFQIDILSGEFQGPFNLEVDETNFRAQVGRFANNSNDYSGTFALHGSKYTISGELVEGESDSQEEANKHEHDTLEYFYAIMIARLLILNVATIVQETDSESLKANWWPSCGFNSVYNVKRFPTLIEGKPGEMGRLGFKISCEAINQSETKYIDDPCSHRVSTAVRGKVVVNASKTVSGERNTYLGYNSILPRDPQATVFHFQSIQPTNFTSYWKYDEAFTPDVNGILELIRGDFSAIVRPITTSSPKNPCVFDKATPVAQFEIDIERPLVTKLELEFEGNPFFSEREFTIESAKLQAMNGFFQGEGNYLDGYIEINGTRFDFDASTDVLKLDYRQNDFDKEYSCRAAKGDISQIIDPNPNWNPTAGCPDRVAD